MRTPGKSVSWPQLVARAIRHDYEEIKKRNPRFSMRAYAKRVGLSPGSLHDFLKNKAKWSLSSERAVELLAKISVSTATKRKILMSMGEEISFEKELLPKASYPILSDWTYYPILISTDLPEPHCSVKATAARLGVRPDKVSAVLTDLVSRGLLEIGPEGKPRRSESLLSTTDNIPSEEIRRHHEVNLEIAAKALKHLPAASRDFTSLTFTGTKESLEEIREEIRSLYEKCLVLGDEGEKNEAVFRLSVQFFPMDFS